MAKRFKKKRGFKKKYTNRRKMVVRTKLIPGMTVRKVMIIPDIPFSTVSGYGEIYACWNYPAVAGSEYSFATAASHTEMVGIF